MTLLRQRAARAIGWSAVEQLSRQLLFFGIAVVMARLVSPVAFGTIALLGLFTGIASVFVNGGLSSALIQKQDADHTDESTVFWYNLLVGTVLGVLLFLAAPWISEFYELPVLIPITRLYSLHLPLAAVTSLQNTLFAKRLDFKTPLQITVLANLPAAVLGIYLAWLGWEVWALAWQALASAVLAAMATWSLSRWRPLLIFSTDSFRSLFRFGGYLFLASLLDTAYNQLYTIFIGKRYGVQDLGLYRRADATKQLPAATLSGLLSRVAFPIFSQTNDDPARLRRGLRLAVRGAMFINIPMMLGMAVVAEPLVATLFGNAWLASAPLLAILAYAGILWPLHVLNLNVLMAMGHSGKFLKVEIIKKLVGLALVTLGAFYGAQGLAWAMVVSSLFSFVFNAHYNGVILNYGPLRQVQDFAPALLAGVLMAGMTLLLSYQLTAFSAPLRLALLCSFGAIAYAVVVSLMRLPELGEVRSLAREFLMRQ